MPAGTKGAGGAKKQRKSASKRRVKKEAKKQAEEVPVETQTPEFLAACAKDPQQRSDADIELFKSATESASFFQKLPSDVLPEVLRVLNYEVLKAGAVLFRQGDLGTSFYVVLSGSVEVVSRIL